MSLRKKLLLILSAVAMCAAIAASLIIYALAGAELERGAERRLSGDAVLLAELIQHQLELELRRFEHWAAMPMVVQTALNQDDHRLLAAFDEYFSMVVKGEPYSSIYLINIEGDCIACDDPRRVFHPHCRTVVSKKPGALSGFAGKTSFDRTEMSLATGRPVAPLTAPVIDRDHVIAILRSSIDIGRLSQEMLGSLTLEFKQKTYMFDPSLSLALPAGHELHTPTVRAPYESPPLTLQTALRASSDTTFKYRDHDGDYLGAAATTRHPSWVFVVSQPMSEILAPIRALRRATALVVVVTLVLLAACILFLTTPVVRGIEQCREFAADVSRGLLDRRLQVRSHDEVGQLAQDLNDMASQIQLNQKELEEAERKYRGIFENAIEGIFHAGETGIFLVANPALAEILGMESPDAIVGLNVKQFIENRHQLSELWEKLRNDSEVTNFSIDFLRLDGAQRQAVISAKADRNLDGHIRLVRGILEDVTKRREAEVLEQRSRETEELLMRTEVEMLRYQVNPHFLFNALNSLRELVVSDPDAGVHMIESLGSFFRASLVNRSEAGTTVADEIAHAESYLQIQQIRFGQRLVTEINTDYDIARLGVPAFMIQPLVENAVKYGQKSKVRRLHVRINAYREDDWCVVKVANTGRWFEQEGLAGNGTTTGLGLENLRRRLDCYFDDRARLEIDKEDGWVTVTIRFPTPEPVTKNGGEGIQINVIDDGEESGSLQPQSRTSR